MCVNAHRPGHDLYLFIFFSEPHPEFRMLYLTIFKTFSLYFLKKVEPRILCVCQNYVNFDSVNSCYKWCAMSFREKHLESHGLPLLSNYQATKKQTASPLATYFGFIYRAPVLQNSSLCFLSRYNEDIFYAHAELYHSGCH